jgi:hypothetical protein
MQCYQENEYACNTSKIDFRIFFEVKNIISHWHLFLQGIFPASYIHLKPCKIDNEG